MQKTRGSSSQNASVTLPGVVSKVIESSFSTEPKKAEIAVEGADPLYKEIRIENTLHDEIGNEVELKAGAAVEVTIDAGSDAINSKKPGSRAEEPLKETAEAGAGRDSI